MPEAAVGEAPLVDPRRRFWSRRDLLRAAALAWPGGITAALAGCGPGPAAARPSSSPRSSSGPMVLNMGPGPSAVPGLVAAFNAAQGAVQAMPFPKSGGTGAVRSLQVGTVTQYALPRGAAASLEPLDVALRVHNVDAAALTGGAVAALQLRGVTYGLPLTQLPWGVRWRTDVFAAAGLDPPAADWTLDEFEAACTALQAFAAAGRAPAIDAALGPFLGEYGMPVDAIETFWVPDAFEAPGLWSGFVSGFGGTVAESGRFALTGAAALEGFGRLVDLARRFGSSSAAAGAPNPTEFAAVLSGCPPTGGNYGLWFAPYVPLLRVASPVQPAPVACAQWKWARLPRFPVSPVIPTVVSGLGLAWQPPDIPRQAAPPLPPAVTVEASIDAAAAFLVWLYQAAPQGLLRAAGFVPVSAAPADQAPFWSAAAADIRALGDYAHFVDYAAGWPAVPPTDYVGQALAQAVAAPANLAALLATAQQQCNAWLAQQASGAGSGAAAG